MKRGIRHKSRELAIQMSYQWLLAPDSLMDEGAIERFWVEQAKAKEDSKPYFLLLIEGLKENLFDIDQKIEAQLKNYRMERVEKVELALLRVAAYELLFHKDVPKAVVINEAIEISKRFCTKDASRFINGVLDSL